MGLERTLWMLMLTFSTCWKVQVNIAGEFPASWTDQHDVLSYQETIMETPHCSLPLSYQEDVMKTPHCPLPLTTPGGHQTPPLNSTGDNIYASEDHLTSSASAVNGAVNNVTRKNGWQRNFLNILELQKTRKVSMLSVDEGSLGQMLIALVKEELSECDLVLAYNTKYNVQAVVQDLLLLHNPRQVVHINTTEDLTRIIWTSSTCRGYIILVDKPEPLLTFATTYQDTWDYRGRFVLVGPSLQYLEAFVDSYVGERTEHVVGVVKSGTEGEWLLYMNQLYWGQGLRRINSWYHHKFTRQVDLFPDKLSDFQGAVLKVSTLHYVPCNFFHRAENGTVLFRYGMDIEIIKAVAPVLNFTIAFTEAPKGELWGDMLEDGSWTGMMGQIQRHEVDMGIAYLFISSYYSQVIDFTTPYTAETMCFMTRMEPPLPHWQALAFPFHKWTWLAVVVGLVIFGPLLFLLARCSDRCGGEIKILQSLSFSWYYAFGLHLSEGHASLPRSTSTQIFVMFLWLYTMILTIVYSTNLMSFLLVKKQPAMMETFQDIYESGLEVAGLSPLLQDGLALSSDPYLRGLAGVFKFYDSLEKVIPPLLQGQAVFLGNRITLDYLIKNRFTRRGVSRVRIMKGNFAKYSVALGLQHHSPLKRKLDQLMGRVRQSGLVRKFFLDSLQLAASLEKDGSGGEDSDSGQEAAADGVIPFSLDHLQGLFLITLFGLICSLLSFILEKTVLSE